MKENTLTKTDNSNVWTTGTIAEDVLTESVKKNKISKPYFNVSNIEKEKHEAINSMEMQLGKYKEVVEMRLERMEQQDFGTRFWNKDAGLWKKEAEEINNSIGWLHVVEKMIAAIPKLQQFYSEIKEAGFSQVILLGMGGSSLAPLVFQRSLTKTTNGLPLTVLDTTDPITIQNIKNTIPLEKTLFIISSKSGTTAEVEALSNYFYHELKLLKGKQAGQNFVAITDSETPLEKLAKEQNFRKTFLNFTDIGGRYSALSYFGMVPAILIGIDVTEFLKCALQMIKACRSEISVSQNPAFILGAAIGELAKQGRDKLTLILPEPVSAFGIWLEQLIAESTGKEKRGILPVEGEILYNSNVYGNDRVFVYINPNGADEKSLIKKRTETLHQAGHPVITIHLKNSLNLAQEFFRWEIATATAGAVLGINPFDQPNVQENKSITNQLLKQIQVQKNIPEEKPVLVENVLSYYASEQASDGKNLLKDFFSFTLPGNYIAILAYLSENKEIAELLKEIRCRLQEKLHLATTLGYGPRFLHSTGQYHKGGPNKGLFLQLTANDIENDISIPQKNYTFGTLRHAQAMGDMEALRNHKRKVIRIDLGKNAITGLLSLKQQIEKLNVHKLSLFME